jgi:hypothetical protein
VDGARQLPRDVLVPLLDGHLCAELDGQTSQRYDEMKARYHKRLRLPAPTSLESVGDSNEDAETGRTTALPTSAKARDGLTTVEVFDRVPRGGRLDPGDRHDPHPQLMLAVTVYARQDV